jgi:hypothetical protein
MKQILPILTVGILVLSGLGAVAITNISTYENKEITIEKSELVTSTFSPFAIEKYDSEYIEVNLEGISTYLSNPGDPVVPKVVKTFELPFGARNIKVEVTVNDVQEYDIEKEIRPGPPHIPLIATKEEIPIIYEKNEKVYSSEELFPSSWHDIDISVGLNDKKERVTHIAIPLYPVRYSPKLNKLYVAEDADIQITYELTDTNPFPAEDKYDMVIIAPRKFSIALNRLIRHKNKYGVETRLKTTESIYREYNGVDKPEQIKRFIQDAIETNNITYVLLVGGLKNKIYANPCEHLNYGAKGWHVPVRYHNFYDNPEHPLTFEKIYDPGVISDLYYADVYRWNDSIGDYEFEDWDSNEDGIIGAWNFLPDPINVTNDTLDLYPDVIVGRLACRNKIEVRTVVSKIINYEKNTYDKSWFKKIVVISGDGFMDQEDLDFQWNTIELPDGKYTILAQSRVGEGPSGVPDKIEITINRNVPTNITFNHDDHLRIDGYPALPIAEIVSISDGNILGNTDFANDSVSEKYAYGNSQTGWANLNFTDGILHIRGKTYDPSPYGNITNIRVWILNESGGIVFDETRYNCEMYYEGEWVTGNKTLKGGGGALYYMPEDFKQEVIWASNGRYKETADIINALGKGCGFAFMSGHGNPYVWSDHFPGIPGNRKHGSTPPLGSLAFKPDILPIIPTISLKKIKNYDKLPVILIGGCHNSQFNVSMIPAFLDKDGSKNTWCYGTPTPECFSWIFISMPRQGAIATIGNTGLGYGVPGKDCLIEGLDGGICIQFFKNYSIDYNRDGYAILGDVYTSTLQAYHDNFDMDNLDHAKSLTQWAFLGDPSLRLGGYP